MRIAAVRAARAERSTMTRTAASASSRMSQDRYSGSGRRQATIPEMSTVLMTPPAKIGQRPEQAGQQRRADVGVPPAWVSQRVKRHKLNFSPVSTTLGRRQATIPEMSTVLMTPPAKIGSVPNRLASSAARMSAGVPCRRGSASASSAT